MRRARFYLTKFITISKPTHSEYQHTHSNLYIQSTKIKNQHFRKRSIQKSKDSQGDFIFYPYLEAFDGQEGVLDVFDLGKGLVFSSDFKGMTVVDKEFITNLSCS